MLQHNPWQFLPTEDDLPETDNIPVDNELQILIPALLRGILALLGADRTDWFLGVNMGIYYNPDKPAIGPDGFLSLGVQRFKSDRGRLSYLLWQEDNVVPQWVLEVVSKTPGGEYGDKLKKYAEMGVLYYVVYNPDYWQRDRHDPFEVYHLVNGVYVRQIGNPVWLPEINLGMGRERGTHEGWTREWLYWYDARCNRFPAPENAIQQERQRAELRAEIAERQVEQERRLKEELLERLRERGINLDEL